VRLLHRVLEMPRADSYSPASRLRTPSCTRSACSRTGPRARGRGRGRRWCRRPGRPAARRPPYRRGSPSLVALGLALAVGLEDHRVAGRRTQARPPQGSRERERRRIGIVSLFLLRSLAGAGGGLPSALAGWGGRPRPSWPRAACPRHPAPRRLVSHAHRRGRLAFGARRLGRLWWLAFGAGRLRRSGAEATGGASAMTV